MRLPAPTLTYPGADGGIQLEQELRLGVIGLGDRAVSLLGIFRRVHSRLRVVAVADPDEDGARQRLRDAELPERDAAFFADADEMLGHAGDFDALLIGSPCNTHTPQAVKAAPAGLPLYLEKPVATSYEQIVALRDAYRGRERSVVVSFPLRVTSLFRKVMEVVESGRLGAVNQVQAVNYVPYGGVYYASPAYREFDVTGGMWLQKATHDFDYLNALLGVPAAVSAVMNRKAYGGDMPHGLRCSGCELAATCLESPQGVARRGDDGGIGTGDHFCVYGDGIELQDAGAALVAYEGGAHTAYTQNFLSRRSAASRGATITGYQATLSFDWYEGDVTVIDHHRDRVDSIRFTETSGHLGGDEALARNFVDVCLGRDESRTGLASGLLSSAMCLAARKSAHSQRWTPVGDVYSDTFPDGAVLVEPTPAHVEPI